MTERICTVEGCERSYTARGWCDAHYRRWKKNGDPGLADLDAPPAKTQVCTVPECSRLRIVRLYCPLHYDRWKRTGNTALATPRQTAAMQPCTFDGCDRPGRTSGLCPAHYLQKFHGRELAPLIDRPDTTARDEHGRKSCSVCGEWQPTDQFYSNPQTRDRLGSWCRSCQKNGVLQKTYGISVLEYERMLVAQDGVCAICGGVNKDGRKLFVDHEHATGVVRGLPCNMCNRGVGLFADDPGRLEAAIAYLKRGPGIAQQPGVSPVRASRCGQTDSGVPGT